MNSLAERPQFAEADDHIFRFPGVEHAVESLATPEQLQTVDYAPAPSVNPAESAPEVRGTDQEALDPSKDLARVSNSGVAVVLVREDALHRFHGGPN